MKIKALSKVYDSYMIHEDDNFGEDSDHKQETNC